MGWLTGRPTLEQARNMPRRQAEERERVARLMRRRDADAKKEAEKKGK